MSAGTVASTSSSGGDSQPNTETIDRSIYVYLIPQNDRMHICYHLDQNNVWEQAAIEMGYATNDIIRVKKMAQDKRISPSEQLLSLWSDQNHTVTELFMVLHRMKQYEAMECLKDHVHKKYHRLLWSALPNFHVLLAKISMETSKRNNASSKILNGPEMSRDTNESSDYSDSVITSNGSDNKKACDIAGLIPFISYEELVTATENWSEKNILGRGGFATVFRGRWKSTEVAIKKLQYKSDDAKKNATVQMKQLETELSFLNSCRHDNILPLYGYSKNGPEPCLVYQFLSGGSLERRLRGKTGKPLTLHQRNRIALGTARGLQYLHTYIGGKPLIHGDIKPANILLDPCCVAKIGDFGLVRQGSTESMEVSSIYGTRPYLPAEFLYHKTLSTKIDTYSFGVVLFELYTAMRAYDKTREPPQSPFLAKFMCGKIKNNEHWMLIDKSLQISSQEDISKYDSLMKIGMECTDETSSRRPEMVQVLQILETLLGNDDDF
ncbi:serine/threonine-protein kinase pelle-like [Contarinia nasturtii]|uniref:serine/threonine-protein kinase pelle-like n=1 Tax=Contarinia nasturtii TaxID=265458 RepID=UPI0012D3A5B0|nr:serine/threonine-protein kinase pelle-like [Contarinia nasturtii]